MKSWRYAESHTIRLLLSSALSCAMIQQTIAGDAEDKTPPPAANTPQRLVSLAPHTTEYVYFLGAGNRLVGAVEYSDYPEEAKQVPRVGGYQTISLEKIASLSPDLVLLWTSGNPSGIRDALVERHAPLFETDPHTLNDIVNDLHRLSQRIGTGNAGEERLQAFEQGIAQLRTQYGNRPKVSVFYQVWEKPLYTLGGTHFFSDLLETCGGTNIYADVKEPSPVVGFESLLSRKPDVILSSARHGDKSLDTWKESWKQWQQIPAVKYGQMYYVNADVFTRPTPRALEAATTLCEHLETARQAMGKTE